MDIKESDMIELYKKLYLIRKSDEKIKKHYYENEMKTPMHMSVGEEAIAVGVCGALSEKDQIFGTHRSHAIYLAKTEDTDGFFAELFGKESGIAKGKAGSMHLSNQKYGFLASSAIVGGNFAMSSGAAFANKMINNGKIVACFFGDGATEEGNFWETVNLSCLWKLPIIFICEDNDVAVYTEKAKRHGYNDICDIINGFNCRVFKSCSTDADEIYKITNECISHIKKESEPCFLHLSYYRYLDHVGVEENFHSSYRDRKDFERWLEVDPVSLYRNKMINKYPLNLIEDLEKEIIDKINQSFDYASKEKVSLEIDLYRDVYE